jgi:hypothetical protein
MSGAASDLTSLDDHIQQAEALTSGDDTIG